MQFTPETREKIAELCKRHGVRELSLFGSRARGAQRLDSDVDLLVDFLPETSIGLLEYSRMQIDLSDLLETRVDLVTRRGLKDHVRDRVLADAQPLYEN